MGAAGVGTAISPAVDGSVDLNFDTSMTPSAINVPTITTTDATATSAIT